MSRKKSSSNGVRKNKKTGKQETGNKKVELTAEQAEKLAPGQSSEALDKLKDAVDQAKNIKAPETAGMTVASILGEIVWLMTQSPAHKHFALSDLEWCAMPPIILSQYRIFRSGATPVGVAFWAYLNEAAEEKIMQGAGRLRPDEWNASGKLQDAMKSGQMTNVDVPSEDKENNQEESQQKGKLWLVDLIAPFGHQDKMLADLVQGPLKDKTFKFHHTSPDGKREVKEIKG